MCTERIVRRADDYLNQFIQTDTIVPNWRDPRTLNRYVYVKDSPINLTDPSGHMADPGCQTEGCSGGNGLGDLNYLEQRAYNLACQQGVGECPPAVQALDQIPAIKTGGDLLGLIYEPDKGKALQKLGCQLLSNISNGMLMLALGGDLDASALSAQAIVGNTGSGNPSIATIEDGSIKTHSGWTTRPGYTQTTLDVLAQGEEMGFTFKPNKKDLVGSPGTFLASHAEAQLSVAAPDQPVGVSNFMCPDCYNYYSKLAQYRGVEQVVADPYYVRHFLPDGTVQVTPR